MSISDIASLAEDLPNSDDPDVWVEWAREKNKRIAELEASRDEALALLNLSSHPHCRDAAAILGKDQTLKEACL